MKSYRASLSTFQVAIQEEDDGSHHGGEIKKLLEDHPTHLETLPGREDLQHLRGIMKTVIRI